MKRHVETSIFREIVASVGYAREARQAVAISGPAGLGKTHALTWLAERESSVAYWSVPNARSSVRAATKAIINAFGCSIDHEHTDQLWEYLTTIVQGPASAGDVLLIDEAQRLSLNILLDIVDFPERYGFPVVIAGNDELLKRTRVTSGAFDQISSRCAKHVILTKPSRVDLNILAADFDVLGPEARAAAIAYGFNTSIRKLVALLEFARGLADRGPIRLAELREAAVFHYGGSQGLSLLKADV